LFHLEQFSRRESCHAAAMKPAISTGIIARQYAAATITCYFVAVDAPLGAVTGAGATPDGQFASAGIIGLLEVSLGTDS
jgi:hypothetical protein